MLSVAFLVLSIQTVFGEICDETLLRKHSNRNAILTAQQYFELYKCAKAFSKKNLKIDENSELMCLSMSSLYKSN